MTPPAPIHISLIVPAHNEAALLPRLLASVDVARASYAPGVDAIEVIVADNGSTDGTADIAHAHGCRVVDVVPRIIASVRNGGAAAAAGTVVAFVDADMQLHLDTFNAVAAALRDPAVIGGATGIVPERRSAGITVAAATLAVFATLTRIDAGLAFCRREDFQALGGYDERRSCAEDVDFLWRLRRLGAARGQRVVRLSGARAVFSTRKFDQFGDWHFLAMSARIIVSRAWRAHAREAVVRDYWYRDTRA